AFRSPKTAEREWAALRSTSEDLLGNLQTRVVAADLGAEKGVWHRLQAGPIASESAAKDLCTALASRNAETRCLPVLTGSD
ncbi:MAG: SPOR domain-containing protein, partial [Minwuiales bacterium]|nr:SPOR domain-containing protein [Minwuiales bacterium]